MKILKIKLEIFNHNFHKYFSKINIFTAGRQYYILLLKTKVFLEKVQGGVCIRFVVILLLSYE